MRLLQAVAGRQRLTPPLPGQMLWSLEVAAGPPQPEAQPGRWGALWPLLPSHQGEPPCPQHQDTFAAL